MELPNASSGPPPNPIIRLSTFIHHHFLRFGTDLISRLDDSRRNVAVNWPSSSPLHFPSSVRDVPFASVTQANQAALSLDGVAKTLVGTSVYTVSNSSNEFVLMSEPNGAKSIGLLCFRQEDAEAFLSQVRLNKGGIKGHARVVPITLDQVYMLKVEGIAFRFMPDPVQIKNALELKASDVKSGFDGVPVFQSDILVVKKKNKRYCPIYFRKEDIEQELSTVSRSVRGSTLSQQIMVGSLEDVLKKMETNEKVSGWEDLIFIPPGKSRSQHIQEIGKAG